MTREALILTLAALVNAGRLRDAQAAALLAAWDRGELTELSVPAAPILASEALSFVYAALAAARRRIATVAAAVLRLPVPTTDLDVARVLSAVDRLPMERRTGLIPSLRADDLRGALSREVQTRTRVLFAARDAATFGPGAEGSAARSAGSVSRWQTAMRQAFAEDAATLARLGAGGELNAVQQARLVAVVGDQAAYVDRYAAYLSRAAVGQAPALSEAQIRAGMVRQSGAARALYFRNAVEREVGSDAEGYEIHYHARDSRDRCTPCLEAERGSPYPASGPFPVPGSVCLGGGACRCTVEVLPIRAAVAA